MKVMIVGEERLAAKAALEAERGLDLVDPPIWPSTPAAGEVEQIAAALRTFEGLFEGQAVDRLLLVGASNPTLAAGLVASRMQIPAAAIGSKDRDRRRGGPAAANRSLIEQLADAVLADDGPAISAWFAEPQPSRPGDGH